jgi:hypothetical protein
MESFKSLQDEISKALVATTRSATRISAADISFQRSLNPEVGTALDTQNARLLHLAQRLLANAAASSDAVGPKLPDVDAIDGDWRGVVDVIDSLLEKADTSLDEYTGVVKRLSPSADAVCQPRKQSMRDSHTDAFLGCCEAPPQHCRKETHRKAPARIRPCAQERRDRRVSPIATIKAARASANQGMPQDIQGQQRPRTVRKLACRLYKS